jgi:hypothetical protein
MSDFSDSSSLDPHSNASLSKVLDREFAILTNTNVSSFSRLQDRASFLGFSSAYLSRLLSGARSLTKAKAEHIAKKLRPDQPNEVESLVTELLASHPPITGVMLKVAKWLSDMANLKSLMVVEFRELPVVRPHGNKASLAKVVGEAVVNGLQYAMVLPFNPKAEVLSSQPSPIQRYVSKLHEEVLWTQKAILQSAIDIILDRLEDETLINRGKKGVKEAVAAAKRLKVYTLKSPDVSPCPGFGYRTFYTASDDDAKFAKRASRTSHPLEQRWEWVSSRDADYMIEKDSSKEELHVTEIQYFPLVEYWRAKKSLPQNDKDFIQFAQSVEAAEFKALYGDRYNERWEVEGVGTDWVEKVVAKEIADGNSAAEESA